jgi:signal transduction histidine kinase
MATRGAEELPTQSQADEQAALLQIAMLVAREAPPEAVFAAVAAEVTRRLRVEAATVLRFLGDERAVVVGVWREGASRGFPVNAELDFDRRNSATGRVRSTGRPARVDSYEGHTGELAIQLRAMDVRASVAAPIVVAGDVWGAVVASTMRDEPLAAGTEHRIGDLAELAACAVAHEQGRRRLEASRLQIVEAADEARRRLERALHDGTQQHLLALSLKLRVGRSRADAGSDIAELIDDAIAEAMTANTALRELARDLYPIVLSERGLAAALQAVAARAPVVVQLRELPRRRFPPTAEATAYFVVAETLGTAGQLGPEPVGVVVADRGTQLVVEIDHAGIGRAEERLRDLAERVAAVGGRLDLDGDSGLRAEIPIERALG